MKKEISVFFSAEGLYLTTFYRHPSWSQTDVINALGVPPLYYRAERLIKGNSGRTAIYIARHNLSFGSRAFRFSAPRIWNSLPLRIRETQSLPAFKRHLKTHFFQSAYPTPSDPPSNAPRFFNRLRRYISFVLTYLLCTYSNMRTAFWWRAVNNQNAQSVRCVCIIDLVRW